MEVKGPAQAKLGRGTLRSRELGLDWASPRLHSFAALRQAQDRLSRLGTWECTGVMLGAAVIISASEF
jgi:hypothetical protein